jgi:hypothetical protein
MMRSMMDSWIGPLAVIFLVVFILIRRGRRLFGRQKFSVVSLGLLLGVVVFLCLMLFLVLSLARGWAPVVGLGIGTAVGLLGIALTRFESNDDELHYTPNSYIGIAVLSLLIGRMTYRLVWMRGQSDLDVSTISRDFAGLQSSPLTVGILFVVLGFYIAYNALVLIRGLKLKEAH